MTTYFVEIKARVHDNNLKNIISNLKQKQYINYATKQCNFFFAIDGRKFILQNLEDGNAYLIYYKQSKNENVQMCNYEVTLVPQTGNHLWEILISTNNIIGCVWNKSILYITKDDSQICLDCVDELGYFIEIKIPRENRDIKTCQKIIENLMQELSITEEDLIEESYLELLIKNNKRIELQTFF